MRSRTTLTSALALLLAPLLVGLAAPAAHAQLPQVLVYDSGIHGAALAQAQLDYPGSVTVATASDFATKVLASPWDMVVVNAPGSSPKAGWPALATYIAGGGKAAMSFWDWDNSSGVGDPVLFTAFEVSSPVSIMLTSGLTMFDSGTSTLFQGVTMPNGDWHNHYSDDGDTFTPTGSAYGLAHFGNPAAPTIVLGNQGRTMALPLLAEAGDTWINSGQLGVLWHNVMDQVLTGGCPAVTSSWISRLGTPANPDVFQAPTPTGPVIGQTFLPFVDHSVFQPSAILDVVSVCAFPINLATPDGTLLVDLTSQAFFQIVNAGQPFALSVPIDCAFVGITVHMQVGSVAVSGLEFTNALQVLIGTN